VSKTIIEGRGTMPAFDKRLREADARELVAYLHKLK
jgi:mono/diheme cytochrome c family protein